MKQIELFYLTRCPYCINAKKAITELIEETPAYGEIEIQWIEEREHPELADARDYYAVPTVFYKEKKLYEAKRDHTFDVIKENIRAAFDAVLKD